MTGMLLSLVNLLTNSDTKHMLLGSRGHFHLNIGFSDDDRILMENFYVFKSFRAKNLIKDIFYLCLHVNVTVLGLTNI